MSKNCSSEHGRGVRKCKASPAITYGRVFEAPIGGKFIPMLGGVPVLLRVPGVPVLWMPCFDTVGELRATLLRLTLEYDDIYMGYGPRFLEALERVTGEEPVRVMLDPIIQPDGSVDFRELVAN